MTEQLPVASRLQFVEVNEPPVVPGLRLKVTVPDGMLEAVVVSVTVTVQVEVWSALIELGLHTIAVDVVSTGMTTVIVADIVLELGLWVESPP